jgi:hypothetical protein
MHLLYPTSHERTTSYCLALCTTTIDLPLSCHIHLCLQVTTFLESFRSYKNDYLLAFIAHSHSYLFVVYTFCTCSPTEEALDGGDSPYWVQLHQQSQVYHSNNIGVSWMHHSLSNLFRYWSSYASALYFVACLLDWLHCLSHFLDWNPCTLAYLLPFIFVHAYAIPCLLAWYISLHDLMIEAWWWMMDCWCEWRLSSWSGHVANAFCSDIWDGCFSIPWE